MQRPGGERASDTFEDLKKASGAGAQRMMEREV